MEISILKDPKEFGVYTVTIADLETIHTTFASEWPDIDAVVRQWVQEIKRLYCKKNKQPLVVGFSAENSFHYRNGECHFGVSDFSKVAYEIFQICVGNHCLIYSVPDHCGSRSYSKDPVVKPLRDFLCSNNIVVVGVGMEETAKKIEKDFGVLIAKPKDLRKLAESYMRPKLGIHKSQSGFYKKYNVERLAKEVLGEDWEIVKPASIAWFPAGHDRYFLSDEKVKYGSVEAFLAYELGVKLLQTDN